eukprot:9571924-Lingulodinium_polyedra.AAC.1
MALIAFTLVSSGNGCHLTFLRHRGLPLGHVVLELLVRLRPLLRRRRLRLRGVLVQNAPRVVLPHHLAPRLIPVSVH